MKYKQNPPWQRVRKQISLESDLGTIDWGPQTGRPQIHNYHRLGDPRLGDHCSGDHRLGYQDWGTTGSPNLKRTTHWE
eukprot:7367323-Karenia_brevis.AAC.1